MVAMTPRIRQDIEHQGGAQQWVGVDPGIGKTDDRFDARHRMKAIVQPPQRGCNA
jgi:hypothetical protein